MLLNDRISGITDLRMLLGFEVCERPSYRHLRGSLVISSTYDSISAAILLEIISSMWA
jgi:hypothetical protein